MGEEKCQLTCSEDSISVCIKRAPDCVFLNKIVPISSEYKGTINIPSLNKLSHLINAIKDDEIVFDVEKNFMTCKTDAFSYKMFFMSDEIMNQRKFDEETFDKIPLPTEFVITGSEFRALRGMVRLADSEHKVYFFQKDGKLFASLTDRNKSYCSDLTLNLSSKVAFPQDLSLNSNILTTLMVSETDDLICQTDGKRLLVVKIGNKKYILSLLL